MQCGRRTNGYVALFVFAALVGLLGQTVVPWLSDHLNPPYLGFRFLVSNIDIYLLIVTALVTFRNTVPKRAFCRVLAFFSGLCLGYDRGDGNGRRRFPIYSISANPRYWKGLNVGDGRVAFGGGLLDKFGWKEGQKVELRDKYEAHDYSLEYAGEGLRLGFKVGHEYLYEHRWL